MVWLSCEGTDSSVLVKGGVQTPEAGIKGTAADFSPSKSTTSRSEIDDDLVGKGDSRDGILPVNEGGTVLTSSETFLLAFAAPLHLDEGFFPASFGTELNICCDTLIPFFVLRTHNR